MAVKIAAWTPHDRGRGVVFSFMDVAALAKISQAELDYQTERIREHAELLVADYVAQHPAVFNTRERQVLAKRLGQHLTGGLERILALPGRGPQGTIGRTLMRRMMNDFLYEVETEYIPDFALEVFQAEFNSKLQYEYDRLLAGEISPLTWEENARDHIRRYYRLSYALGKHRAGQPPTMTAEDIEWLRETVNKEFAYLHRFRLDMERRLSQGIPLSGRDQVRWDMYKRALRSIMQAGVQRWVDWVDWILDPEAEHCADCPGLAAASPWLCALLPTYPGAGETQCLRNCQCALRPIGAPDDPEVERNRLAGWLDESWIVGKQADGDGAMAAEPARWFTDESGRRIPVTEPRGRRTGAASASEAARTAPAAPSATRVPRHRRPAASGVFTGRGFTSEGEDYVGVPEGGKVQEVLHERYSGRGTHVLVDTRVPVQGHKAASYTEVADLLAAMPQELCEHMDAIRLSATIVKKPDALGRDFYTGAEYTRPTETAGARVVMYAMPAELGRTTADLAHEMGHVVYDALVVSDHPIADRWRENFAASALGMGDQAPEAYGDYYLTDPEEDFACAFGAWWDEQTGGREAQLRGDMLREYQARLGQQARSLAQQWLEGRSREIAAELAAPKLGEWSPQRATLMQSLMVGEPIEEEPERPPGTWAPTTPEEYATGFEHLATTFPGTWQAAVSEPAQKAGDKLLIEGVSTGFNVEQRPSRYETAKPDYSNALASAQDSVVYHMYTEHTEHGAELLRRVAEAGFSVPYYVTTRASTVLWEEGWDREAEMTYERLGDKLVGRSVEYAIVWMPETPAQADGLADIISDHARAGREQAIEHSWQVPDVRARSGERVDAYERRWLHVKNVRGDDIMFLSSDRGQEGGEWENFDVWLNPELAEFIKGGQADGGN